MNKVLKSVLIVFLLVNSQFVLTGQLSSIHQIEDAKNHYKSLQKINDGKMAKFSSMDEIVFPPELYKNRSLLYAMVNPIYLISSQVGFLVNAVNHPANSSKQTRAELDFLLELQSERTAEQTKEVMELAKVGYWPAVNYVPSHPNYKENLDYLFYQCEEIVGDKCTSDNYPNTSILLQGVMNDMRIMEFSVKYHLLRARPYQLEPRLEPLKKINSPSFASGHTLWAYIQAYTLCELMPEKRMEFLDLAYKIGLSREIMGVHYPSDEEVARQLAHRMLRLMWQTEKFQNDFSRAKAEWQ